jgi:hypothetical protein
MHFLIVYKIKMGNTGSQMFFLPFISQPLDPLKSIKRDRISGKIQTLFSMGLDHTSDR